MATTVLSTVLAAGATAALVSGVTLMALKPESTSARAATEALEPTFDDSELTRVQGEMESLRLENRDLRDRLVALEEAALRNPAEARVALAPETATSSETLEQLAAALTDPNGGPPPAQFQATVEAVLGDIRAKEEAEAEAKREERRAERRDQRLETMRTELGLDDRQVNDMRDLYTNIEAEISAAREQARELRDFEGMREAMRNVRETSMTQVESILTPSQFETYQENNMDRALLGRGGGGNRGGNNGGGGNAGGGGNNGGGNNGGGFGRRGGR